MVISIGHYDDIQCSIYFIHFMVQKTITIAKETSTFIEFYWIEHNGIELYSR